MNITPKQIAEFSSVNHRRVAHIQRFNTTPILIRENVAEHSYFVAFYSMLLCEYVRQFGFEPDVEKTLKRALMHDVEEIISGDIITTFKYKNEEFRSLLETLNEGSMDEILKSLPTELSDNLKDLWKNSKDDSIEGLIVKASDKLSLVTYCMEQINIGNKYMEPIFYRAVKMLKDLNTPWVTELVDAFIEQNKLHKLE